MPSPPKLPEQKWPLTHRESIEELERLLNVEHEIFQAFNRENIVGAIEFHRSFDLDDLCEARLVTFVKGKVVEDTEDPPMGPAWTEVGNRFL